MENYKFDKTNIEDCEDALLIFEKNYNIKFEDDELRSVRLFSDFIEKIIEKFDFAEMYDCTFQQAFYKLRKAIKEISPGFSDITLDTELKDIFPPKNRKLKITELKKKLGFDFKILGAEMWITSVLGVTILVCFFLMFFQLWALVIFIFSIIILQVAEQYGKEFQVKTIRDLVNHLVQHHYFECRRTPKTIHKEEFRKVLYDYFSEELNISLEDLKTAKFV